MNFLVTGGAGFIGSHLIDKLLSQGNTVVNIDNFDDFYSKDIKMNNIRSHLQDSRYTLVEADISTNAWVDKIKDPAKIDAIIHLAAKAGVRPSIDNPAAYFNVNVTGTLHVMEFARTNGIKKVVFASSSSVYGSNPSVPWKESDCNLLPISPYAASKIAAENIGRVYSYLYDIRFIALRFFTVYGPRQRPDLAIHKFFRQIMNGEMISLYGNGSTRRDYTFIDDIIGGVLNAIAYDKKQFEIFNLGNSQTITLMDLVKNIEETCGKAPLLNYLQEQPGDVEQTYADIAHSKANLSYSPVTDIKTGLKEFYKWYKTL